ncbi:MAG: GIY-YIG nuclease family protein [Flavobacteriales bacterium]
MGKTSWVYIMSNRRDGVLYIGVTSDLKGRIAKHKSKHYATSFTARYNLDKLVYYEQINGIVKAIEREKQLKADSRNKKLKLNNAINPDWRDLVGDLSSPASRTWRI